MSTTWTNGYRSRKELTDDREFHLGEIWKIRDNLIRLLPSDRIKDERTLYPSRTVVVVQNCETNCDPLTLTINVAPLSSTVKYANKYDIILCPKNDQVKEECMVQLELTQPVLKKDMYEKVGDISREKKAEIIAGLTKLLGIDLQKFKETIEEQVKNELCEKCKYKDIV